MFCSQRRNETTKTPRKAFNIDLSWHSKSISPKLSATYFNLSKENSFPYHQFCCIIAEHCLRRIFQKFCESHIVSLITNMRAMTGWNIQNLLLILIFLKTWIHSAPNYRLQIFHRDVKRHFLLGKSIWWQFQHFRCLAPKIDRPKILPLFRHKSPIIFCYSLNRHISSFQLKSNHRCSS